MANQNRLKKIMAVAAVASLLAARAANAQESKFTARLEAARATYPQWAPIEVLLSVSNRSGGAAWIGEDYPRFAVPGHEGVTIRPRGAARAEGRYAPPPGQFGGVTYRHLLAAGETSTYKIYLQRFMPDLPVGEHSLSYSVNIALDVGNGQSAAAVGEGTLEFGVFPGDDAGLTEILAAYAAELEVSDLTKSDYWVNRAAEEALAVTSSPLVIRYLKRLFEVGTTGNDLSPLAKFRGNSDAEDLLLSIVRKGKGYNAPSGLSVLEQWNYALSERDFASLCEHQDSSLRYALLKYAEKMNRASYLPATAALVNDSTPAVAAEAKRAEAALRAGGR